jgi:hypothetical protein
MTFSTEIEKSTPNVYLEAQKTANKQGNIDEKE